MVNLQLHFIGVFCLIVLATTLPAQAQSNSPPSSAVSTSAYDQIITAGNAKLKADNFTAAHEMAMKALGLDGNRFEAYALEALAEFKAGKTNEAKGFIEIALAKVPAAKKTRLQALAAVIEGNNPPAVAPSGNGTIAASAGEQLKGDDRLEYETLLSMLQDADKATGLDDRHRILGDFLDQSGDFLKKHPGLVRLWVARGAVAVELDRIHDGWEAGQKLTALGLKDSNDSSVQKVMVELNKMGWLVLTPEQIVSWLNAHLDSCISSIKKDDSSVVATWATTSFNFKNGILTISEKYEVELQYHLASTHEIDNIRIPLNQANVVISNIASPFGSNSQPISLNVISIIVKGGGITMTGKRETTTPSRWVGSSHHSEEIDRTNLDRFEIRMKDMQSAQSFAATLSDLIKLESGGK
jgi:hypothetical protein